MFRKILYFNVLLFSSFSFGQQYSLWVSGQGFTIDLDFSVCRVKQVLTMKYLDVDSSSGVLSTGIYDLKSGTINVNGEIRVSTGGAPGCGASCSDIENFSLNRLQTHFIGIEGDGSILPRCFTINKKNQYTTSRKLEQSAVILPKYVQPIGLNNERVLTDKLFKSITNTFNIPQVTLPNVKWQYQTDKSFFFKDFPIDLKNKFPMNATLKEILKDELIDIKTINNIKVKIIFTPPGFTTSGFPFPTMSRTPIIESSILIFDIFNPSPEFKEAKPQDVTCNYDENGSFELVLGRNLNTNEKLAVTIFEKDTGNVPSGGQNLNITTLTANSDGTFSYKWPEILPPNEYKIKYQTGTTSENLSNVFSSLEPAGEVEIKKTKEVTYSLTSAVDKTCFTRDDGYIDIRADGQGGRTFFYQYLKNGVVQKLAGEEWIPFTNARTTRIMGLGEANYRVKVQDSEKCFYRK